MAKKKVCCLPSVLDLLHLHILLLPVPNPPFPLFERCFLHPADGGRVTHAPAWSSGRTTRAAGLRIMRWRNSSSFARKNDANRPSIGRDVPCVAHPHASTPVPFHLQRAPITPRGFSVILASTLAGTVGKHSCRRKVLGKNTQEQQRTPVFAGNEPTLIHCLISLSCGVLFAARAILSGSQSYTFSLGVNRPAACARERDLY